MSRFLRTTATTLTCTGYLCLLTEVSRLRSRPAMMTRWNESSAVRFPAQERYTLEEIEDANEECARAQKLAEYLMSRLERLAA